MALLHVFLPQIWMQCDMTSESLNGGARRNKRYYYMTARWTRSRRNEYTRNTKRIVERGFLYAVHVSKKSERLVLLRSVSE
jgi:hypothetical protein